MVGKDQQGKSKPKNHALTCKLENSEKEAANVTVTEHGGTTSKEKRNAPSGPFPDFRRPSAEECIAARKFLSNLHWGSPDATAQKDSTVLETEKPGSPGFSVLDSLIATILSQNTTDTNSWPAFQRLKSRFPSWDLARQAPVESMEECIRSAGLAKTKSARIHSILNALASERPGEPLSLEHLRSEPDTAAAMAQLTRFSGVGPKTAACVAMFTLGRPEFPVDTHVLRLALALGWVPRGTGREAAYEHLNQRVPDAVKYDLHVLLVLHGKVYRNDASMLRRALATVSSGASTTHTPAIPSEAAEAGRSSNISPLTPAAPKSVGKGLSHAAKGGRTAGVKTEGDADPSPGRGKKRPHGGLSPSLAIKVEVKLGEVEGGEMKPLPQPAAASSSAAGRQRRRIGDGGGWSIAVKLEPA